MRDFIKNLVPHRTRDEETGASAVEYGLLVAAIAALIVVIVFALGGIVENVFSDTCNDIGGETGGDVTDCGTPDAPADPDA